MDETDHELRSGNLNPSDYDFKKYYKIIITMQNVGQTMHNRKRLNSRDRYDRMEDTVEQPQTALPGRVNLGQSPAGLI